MKKGFFAWECRRFCSGQSILVQYDSTEFKSSPQRKQNKSLGTSKFPEISTNARIWFGTRGSEVQILSPRPIVSNYLQQSQELQNRATWFCTRCSSVLSRIDTAFVASRRVKDR